VRAFVSRLIDLPKRAARWVLRKELADIREALEKAEDHAKYEFLVARAWRGRWEQLHYQVHGAGATQAFDDFIVNEAATK
jgi:hypothetical protein